MKWWRGKCFANYLHVGLSVSFLTGLEASTVQGTYFRVSGSETHRSLPRILFRKTNISSSNNLDAPKSCSIFKDVGLMFLLPSPAGLTQV